MKKSLRWMGDSNERLLEIEPANSVVARRYFRHEYTGALSNPEQKETREARMSLLESNERKKEEHQSGRLRLRGKTTGPCCMTSGETGLLRNEERFLSQNGSFFVISVINTVELSHNGRNLVKARDSTGNSMQSGFKSVEFITR